MPRLRLLGARLLSALAITSSPYPPPPPPDTPAISLVLLSKDRVDAIESEEHTETYLNEEEAFEGAEEGAEGGDTNKGEGATGEAQAQQKDRERETPAKEGQEQEKEQEQEQEQEQEPSFSPFVWTCQREIPVHTNCEGGARMSNTTRSTCSARPMSNTKGWLVTVQPQQPHHHQQHRQQQQQPTSMERVLMDVPGDVADRGNVTALRRVAESLLARVGVRDGAVFVAEGEGPRGGGSVRAVMVCTPK